MNAESRKRRRICRLLISDACFDYVLPMILTDAAASNVHADTRAVPRRIDMYVGGTSEPIGQIVSLSRYPAQTVTGVPVTAKAVKERAAALRAIAGGAS